MIIQKFPLKTFFVILYSCGRGIYSVNWDDMTLNIGREGSLSQQEE